MSRLTLRLPESLHRQLEAQAKNENVSLNQYLVYALTRYTSVSPFLMSHSEHDIQQQRVDYEHLRKSLRRGSPTEVRAALDEAERVSPEPDLDSDLANRLRYRINEARVEYQTENTET